MAASGVHPKLAQSIMRHSDINLTMSRYSHVLRGQESEAIAGLPDFSLPSKKSQRAKATGTDGSGELTPKWTPYLTHSDFSECNRDSALGNKQCNHKESSGNNNYLNGRELGTKKDNLALSVTGEKEMGRGGFEPPTHGFSVRCSTN